MRKSICPDCGRDASNGFKTMFNDTVSKLFYSGIDGGWYCDCCIKRHLPMVEAAEDSEIVCEGCEEEADELYQGDDGKWYCYCCIHDNLEAEDFEEEPETEPDFMDVYKAWAEQR